MKRPRGALEDDEVIDVSSGSALEDDESVEAAEAAESQLESERRLQRESRQKHKLYKRLEFGERSLAIFAGILGSLNALLGSGFEDALSFDMIRFAYGLVLSRPSVASFLRDRVIPTSQPTNRLIDSATGDGLREVPSSQGKREKARAQREPKGRKCPKDGPNRRPSLELNKGPRGRINKHSARGQRPGQGPI